MIGVGRTMAVFNYFLYEKMNRIAGMQDTI